MREPTSIHAMRRHAIRRWLLAVAALIFAMVLVGGATRLTESGLSITEWQPVTGTIPPLSEAAWQAEFEKYKTIPQYQTMNRGMSLGEFKTIYWWEWTHRLFARLIGAAFLLPLLWFLWRGWVEPGLRGPLLAISGLLALEPVVGWWMVASGLAARSEVSQYRLAFHLTLACVIFVAMVWTAERLVRRPAMAVAPRLRATAMVLLVLVLAQIYLGALTAGLRAGLTYNTWPLIDGAFIPASAHLLFDQPWWRNFFENTLMVQFDHRMMAYTVTIVALVHAVDAARAQGRGIAAGAAVLALAVMLQAALGVLTLLYQVPIWLGLAHQGLALVVLTLASLHAARAAAGIRLPPVPAPDRR